MPQTHQDQALAKDGGQEGQGNACYIRDLKGIVPQWLCCLSTNSFYFQKGPSECEAVRNPSGPGFPGHVRDV